MGAPWRKDGIGYQGPTLVDGAKVSRRATLAGGTTALAAALAMAACSADPMPDAFRELTPQINTALRDLIDGAGELVVAGAHVNVGLLRRFYARHGFEPVWTARRAQADALMAAVLRAGDQGLDPELFHATLLRDGATLSHFSANCCYRTRSCPMPTRWPAARCRSSAGEMTRFWRRSRSMWLPCWTTPPTVPIRRK